MGRDWRRSPPPATAPSADSTRSPRSLLPNEAKLQEHDERQHREQEERDGGALAEIAALQANLIRERREQVRGVHGAAAREDLHDVEVAEREDRREQHDDREHR